MASIPTTPVRGYPILGKHRSTRKGQVLSGPLSGPMGVPGRDGTHYYDIALVPAGGGREKITCSCPAFRFRKAHQVQRTGLCKHLQAVLETLAIAPETSRTDKGDIIVYAGEALATLLREARK